MTTDENVIENESTDYKLGYDAGFEAGKQALKEEVEKSARSGSEVYALTSYSMLSDLEVRNLIEFCESIAKKSVEANSYRSAAQAMSDMQMEMMGAICTDAQNVLNSIIANTPNYEGVTPSAVTTMLTNQEEV